MTRKFISLLLLSAAIILAACNSERREARRAAKMAQESEQTDGQQAVSPISIEPLSSAKILPVKGSVRIEKIEDISLNGLSSCILVLRISNTTDCTVAIEQGTAALSYAGSKVGTITLIDEVSIAGRSIASVTAHLALSLDNLFAGMTVSNKIRKGDLDKIDITLDAVIRIGDGRQRVSCNDIPLAEALSAAGIATNNK